VDSKHALYVNEVLCFLQQECNIIPVDDLVKLCAYYYTAEEIEQARLMLSKFVSKKRIGKRWKLLRREVRAMTDMKQEVAQLRQIMTALNPVSQEMTKADKNIISSESQVAPASSRVSACISTRQNIIFCNCCRATFAGGLKPARQVSKPIIGASAWSKFIKAVTTTRTVDVFVSRLHPMTSEAELQELVNFVKGDLSV
jgi:hypothetical protein